MTGRGPHHILPAEPAPHTQRHRTHAPGLRCPTRRHWPSAAASRPRPGCRHLTPPPCIMSRRSWRQVLEFADAEPNRRHGNTFLARPSINCSGARVKTGRRTQKKTYTPAAVCNAENVPASERRSGPRRASLSAWPAARSEDVEERVSGRSRTFARPPPASADGASI